MPQRMIRYERVGENVIPASLPMEESIEDERYPVIFVGEPGVDHGGDPPRLIQSLLWIPAVFQYMEEAGAAETGMPEGQIFRRAPYIRVACNVDSHIAPWVAATANVERPYHFISMFMLIGHMLGDFRDYAMLMAIWFLGLIVIPGIFIYLVAEFRLLGLAVFCGVSGLALYRLTRKR